MSNKEDVFVTKAAVFLVMGVEAIAVVEEELEGKEGEGEELWLELVDIEDEVVVEEGLELVEVSTTDEEVGGMEEEEVNENENEELVLEVEEEEEELWLELVEVVEEEGFLCSGISIPNFVQSLPCSLPASSFPMAVVIIFFIRG